MEGQGAEEAEEQEEEVLQQERVGAQRCKAWW
jgi:hypothetical protein